MYTGLANLALDDNLATSTFRKFLSQTELYGRQVLDPQSAVQIFLSCGVTEAAEIEPWVTSHRLRLQKIHQHAAIDLAARVGMHR